MKITSVQKVIKVGSSLAVTIPARDARAAGISAGEEVEVSVQPINTPQDVMTKELTEEYEAFKLQYSQTLKNLSQR